MTFEGTAAEPYREQPRLADPPLFAQTALTPGLRAAVRGKGTRGDGDAAVPPAEGCTSGDPWPGYDGFCPDDVEAEMNTILSGSRGTTVKPTPPSVPNGTASTTTCDDNSCLEAAALSTGHNAITLTGDITGGVWMHDGSSGWQDVTVYMDGFSIDSLVFANLAGTAARVAFIGPGWIKSVLGHPNAAAAVSDLIFHGVWMRRDDDAFVTFESGGSVDLDRVSITGSIIGGYPSGGSNCAAFMLGGGDDIVIANSNVEACPNSSGNHDTWAIRTSGSRVWGVDTMWQSHGSKNVARFAAGSQIMYTTDACAGDVTCALVMVHEERGAMHSTIGDPDIDADLGLSIRNFWYVGDNGSLDALWGPQPTTDYWFMGGTTICSDSSGHFGSTHLAAVDNGSTWLTDNLSYDGEATSISHASPVSGCPLPSWPTRSADAIDGIANSAVANVGSDPMGTPP